MDFIGPTQCIQVFVGSWSCSTEIVQVRVCVYMCTRAETRHQLNTPGTRYDVVCRYTVTAPGGVGKRRRRKITDPPTVQCRAWTAVGVGVTEGVRRGDRLRPWKRSFLRLSPCRTEGAGFLRSVGPPPLPLFP